LDQGVRKGTCEQRVIEAGAAVGASAQNVHGGRPTLDPGDHGGEIGKAAKADSLRGRSMERRSGAVGGGEDQGSAFEPLPRVFSGRVAQIKTIDAEATAFATQDRRGASAGESVGRLMCGLRRGDRIDERSP
jgi:hypothetical protein